MLRGFIKMLLYFRLADELKESLYGRETDRDHLRNADLRSA